MSSPFQSSSSIANAVSHRSPLHPSPLPLHPSRCTRAAFTLLEILVAMSLMAILAGITISTLAWTGGGTQLESGQNLLNREMERARSLAILRQSSVRLIIYAQHPAQGGDPERYLRQLGIVYETEIDSGQWLTKDRGTSLPDGVIVVPDSSIPLPGWDESLDRTRSSSMTLQYPASTPVSSGSGDTYLYFEFKSTGRMSGLLNDRIVLAQGKWENGDILLRSPIEARQIRLNSYGLKFNLEERE